MRSGGFATNSSLDKRDAASARRAEHALADAVPARAPWFFGIMLVLGALNILLRGLIPGVAATTFHVYDAALVAVVAVGPVLVALLVFATGRLRALMRDEADATGEPAFSPRQMVAVGLLLVGAPTIAALWANQELDRSRPVAQSLTVGETWTSQDASGTLYHARVTPDLRPPLRYFSFYGDGTHDVLLAPDDWARVTPGRTRLILATHRGAFGFGWIEPSVTVTP